MLVSSATFNEILGFNNDLISSYPEFSIVRKWMLKNVAPETSEKQAFNIIRSQHGLSQLMKAYADDVRSDFISNAEQPLRRTIDVQPFRTTEALQTISLIRQLHDHYFHFTKYVDIPKSVLNLFETSYQSLLTSTLTPAVFTMVVTTYLRSFDLCDRNDIVYDNVRVLKNARSDNLIEKLVREKFLSDFKKRIEQDHKMKWNESIFNALDAWILNTVLPDSLNLVSLDKDNMLSLLNSCAKEAIVHLRTQELFDIMVDFPSSRPALKDLRQAITTSKQRITVVSAFQKSCADRLLHGGANTVDILYGYISAIKCFKILDPRGVLLERISKPIRKYLKERDDTISELVSGLLGVSTSNISDLSSEMKSSKTGKSHLLPHANDLNWYPDPIDAPVDFSTDNNFDIVGNLLSMYDNKDAIIKELMKRFAEKMLLPSENLSEDIVSDLIAYLVLKKYYFFFLLLTYSS
jgi:anaphase-promoting complex subunit 2